MGGMAEGEEKKVKKKRALGSSCVSFVWRAAVGNEGRRPPTSSAHDE